MIIRSKHSGYVNGNNRLYPGGGGGGQNTTTGTTYTSNIPEYLQPYVETMMGATEKEVYNYDNKGNISGFKPFQSYAQYDQKRGGTGESVAGFTPMQVQSMQNMQNYRLPNQTQYGSKMAGMAGLGSMQAGNQYAQQATNPYAMRAYMSPYMENAIAPELREAARQSAIQGQANQAQAVQQGAFGGGRSAIIEAERQRNLAQQQGDIYGKGMQNAYQNAQQAQQFGSTLGLQGYGQALEGAKTLGSLGQAQYGQEMGLMGQQQAVGKMQQDYEQSRINQIIQDYATSQQYPLMQLGVLNAMTRGLPMQASTSQMYQAQPSMASQIAGGLGTTAQLYNTFNQATKGSKEGGIIKMAAGGIASGVSPNKLPSMLKKLSDPQLGQKDQDQNTDPETKQMVDAEQARRGALRNGIKTMAAGGAIAFADGKEVEDPELEKDKEVKDLKDTKKGILGTLAKESPTTPVIKPEMGVTPEDTRFPPEPPVTDAAYPDLKGSVADEARKGIATSPAKSANNIYAAYEKTLEDQAAAEKTKSEQSVNDIISNKEAERKKAGFENPATKELAELASRQQKINDDAKELAQDRLVQFLINWGKTPGPAINGFISAGDKLITDNIEDKKTRKKLLEDLEDVRRGINRSEYERRLGNEKEAEAIKTKAGEQYFNINKELLKHRADMSIKAMDMENKLKIQELKNELIVAKGANKDKVIQQAEILYAEKVFRGAPENPSTMRDALIEANAMQPVVTATAMTIPSRETTAGAASSQADTASKKAGPESTLKGAQTNTLVDKAVDKEAFNRRKEIQPQLDKAKTDAEKAKIRKDFRDRIRPEVEKRVSKFGAQDASTTVEPPAGFNPDQ
jgi:hypothetical protein